MFDMIHTAQMKFFIKDFFSKYDQIRSFLRICSHLLKKSLMENFIFCAVPESLSFIRFPAFIYFYIIVKLLMLFFNEKVHNFDLF